MARMLCHSGTKLGVFYASNGIAGPGVVLQSNFLDLVRGTAYGSSNV